MSDARPTVPKPTWRRRRWRFPAALVLVVACHAPLLRGISGLLVVDAPFAGGDLLCLRNDSETLAATAELFARGGYERVWVIPNRPSRTDELGITASSFDEVRGELSARGVPQDRIHTAAPPADGNRLRLRAACTFVREQPERTVTLVTSRYEGRAVERGVAGELDAATAARMALASGSPKSFDERHWWSSRPAIQRVFRGYWQWASAVSGGEPQIDRPTVDWQAFEAAVARGEKP